jgi:hypothetical protein
VLVRLPEVGEGHQPMCGERQVLCRRATGRTNCSLSSSLRDKCKLRLRVALGATASARSLRGRSLPELGRDERDDGDGKQGDDGNPELGQREE